jgi:hypothetical protein
MGLEKAVLINLETGEEIRVCFNPTEYQVDKSVPWSAHAIKGLDAPEMQFTLGDPRRLAMELLFDTYEDGEDVRKRYTQKIENLCAVKPQKKRPPRCQFLWGKWAFDCFVESVSQRFTMFLEDGRPVRAIMRVTLVEALTAKEQRQRRGNPGPADRTKRRSVRQGENLALIAYQEYGDARQWRPIAEANDIDDPKVLKPGQLLVVPPLS